MLYKAALYTSPSNASSQPSASLPIMGGGQNAACNLDGRPILISAFKAGKDREDNLTLICILSTRGGKKMRGKKKADTRVMGRTSEMPEDPGDGSPFSCLSIY